MLLGSTSESEAFHLSIAANEDESLGAFWPNALEDTNRQRNRIVFIAFLVLLATRFFGFFVLVLDLLSGPNFERCQGGTDCVFSDFEDGGLACALRVRVLDRQVVAALFGKKNRESHDSKR